MLYEYELGHDVAKATKDICYAKVENSVDNKISNQMVNELPLGLQERQKSKKFR